MLWEWANPMICKIFGHKWRPLTEAQMRFIRALYYDTGREIILCITHMCVRCHEPGI